jgi:antirestriction protein ArdC
MSTVIEKKKTSSPKRSVYKNDPKDMFQEVTDRIIKALEQGVAPWKKPWTFADSGLSGFPVNAVTGRQYSGINVLLLWMACVDNGFVSNRWLTFQQALNAGGNVIKGQRGTYATVYRPFEQVKTDKDGHVVYDENGHEVMEPGYYASRCVLFNALQCENLPDEITRMPQLPVLPELQRLARAEELIAGSKVGIIHRRQNRAFYRPSVDCITMPLMGQFRTAADYYSTVLHELTHATGHQNRLAREGIIRSKGQFGDPVYAFEELIAEIGSAFLCTELGIQGNIEHENYIGCWIKRLKEDKSAIFSASRYAREAFEYLMREEQLNLAD